MHHTFETNMAAEPRGSDSLTLRSLSPTLGAEIMGVDLAALDDPGFDRLYEAFLEHQMLLFRDQDLTPGEQVVFARRFGSVQVHVLNQYHAEGFPEIFYLSNLDASGRPSGKHPDKGTVHWHTDGSWARRTGHATLLYADQVPSEGGQTRFASMYAAYEQLDDATRQRLGSLRAIHSLDFSRTRRHGEDLMSEAQKKARPPVAHPIVRIHPETGRRCLFLGDHAWCVEGMPEDEGRALIEELNAAIIDPALVYTHQWRPGDLVLWDNRCMLHKAEPYDTGKEARVLRRCTVVGEVPI
jgi:alpha-ketoglutarate-dependent 2,4-dichlorophenoxyacetate dioxygenase